MASSQSSRAGSEEDIGAQNQLKQLPAAIVSHDLFIPPPAKNSSGDSGNSYVVHKATMPFGSDSNNSNESQSDWHSFQLSSSSETYGPGVQAEVFFDADQPGNDDSEPTAQPENEIPPERIPSGLSPAQVQRWKNLPASKWEYSIICAIFYRTVSDVALEDDHGAMDHGYHGLDLNKNWTRARNQIRKWKLYEAYRIALQYEQFARTYVPHTESEWLALAHGYSNWNDADVMEWVQKYLGKHTPSLWQENAARFDTYLPTWSTQKYSLRLTRSSVQVGSELDHLFRTVFRTNANGHLHHPNGPLWSPRDLFPHKGKRHSRWIEKEMVALWGKLVAWKRYVLVFPEYTTSASRKRPNTLNAEIPSPEPGPRVASRKMKSFSSMKVCGKKVWEQAGRAVLTPVAPGEGWAYSSLPAALPPMFEAESRKLKVRDSVHFTVRDEKVLERRRIHDIVRGWKIGGLDRHQRIYENFFWTEGIEYVNSQES